MTEKENAYLSLREWLDEDYHSSNNYGTYSWLVDLVDTLKPGEPDPETVQKERQSKMKLEELKQMLDTDARKRCAAHEQTIKELHQKIAEQKKEIERLRKIAGLVEEEG